MACWPCRDCTRLFYTARETHSISKLYTHAIWALFWNSENAYGKQAGLGVFNDQWSKHLDVVKKGGEMFTDMTDGWLSILPAGDERTYLELPLSAPLGVQRSFSW